MVGGVKGQREEREEVGILRGGGLGGEDEGNEGFVFGFVHSQCLGGRVRVRGSNMMGI